MYKEVYIHGHFSVEIYSRMTTMFMLTNDRLYYTRVSSTHMLNNFLTMS